MKTAKKFVLQGMNLSPITRTGTHLGWSIQRGCRLHICDLLITKSNASFSTNFRHMAARANAKRFADTVLT